MLCCVDYQPTNGQQVRTFLCGFKEKLNPPPPAAEEENR